MSQALICTGGYGDSNRDVAKHINDRLVQETGRTDLYCYYSPISPAEHTPLSVEFCVCMVTNEQRFTLQEMLSQAFEVGKEIDPEPFIRDATEALKPTVS